MSELLQRRSLSEQVYDVLIHDIVTGQIALGDRLINRELQTRFGVSSTPIRDAINKLYQDGLIRELTNSGAQLIDFDQQYAEELNHFIMMLACEALLVMLSVSASGRPANCCVARCRIRNSCSICSFLNFSSCSLSSLHFFPVGVV